MNIIKYDTLVLSGGGSYGFLQLGVFHCIEQYYPEILTNIQIVSGCSIGAIIGYLYIIGLTSNEIFYFLIKLLDVSKKIHLDLTNTFNSYGLYNQTHITPILIDISLQKIGVIPTLIQLKKLTGKTLICSVYNFTDSKLEYLSLETYPDLSCIDALLMSSAIPIIFSPFIFNDKQYIDSGIVDNFPVECIYAQSTNILGINTSSDFKKWDVKNIIDYFYKILNIGRVIYIENKNYDDKMNSINLNFNLNSNFSVSRTEKADMFISGYNKANQFFKNLFKQ